MNTLKLLAFVRLYITYIFQVLIKYYLNTDLVVIGQILSGFASDFRLTNFAPTSAFHAVDLEFSSAFPSDLFEGDPKHTRINTEQRWEKGRSWSSIVHVMLCCIAVVSMSSLSAQTSRKDSGAMGLKPLKIGDTIPEALWKMPLTVINHHDGKETISLSDYKNKKLLILDFWASYCSPCIGSITKISSILKNENLADKIVLLPALVHDTPERGGRFLADWNSSMWSIDDSNFQLKSLFSNYISGFGVVLISDGKFVAAPSAKDISYEKLKRQAFSELVEWMNVSKKGVQR